MAESSTLMPKQRGAAAITRGVDEPISIGAAAYLVALNALIVNVQPLILGALAEGYGLADRDLGYISSVYIGFNTLCTLTGPWWVRRVDWRITCFCALFVATLALGAGALVGQLVSILLLFAVIGLAKGMVFVPSFASLGDASNPDRSYGISVALQSVTAAAVAAPLSAYVIPHFGVQGLFLTIAALMATGLVACIWVPSRGRLQTAPEQLAAAAVPLLSRAAVPAMVALLALMAFGGGAAAFWFFVERIGTDRGVAHGVIGSVISFTALSGIVTSSAVAALGGRVSTLLIIATGVAGMLLGYASLAAEATLGFVLCNLLFALGWGFATPAFWAVLRKVDATGRLFVAAAAASGLAAVLVGLVVGNVIEVGGYAGLIAFSSLLLILSCALAGVSAVIARQPMRAASQ